MIAHARRAARSCEACLTSSASSVHRQMFRLFDDDSGLAGYDVVTCDRCGFIYADDLPDQDVFDRYYRDLSKYESYEGDGAVAPWAATIHRSIVAEISSRLPDRQARILDVGAASGHLLAAFRDAGYERIVGFDPSARCTELARERYGVRVINDPISKLALDGERFDLITLASVLEHLRDIDRAMAALIGVLAPGGAVWFEIPNAARFAEHVHSPYHQFSLEHVNFFTRSSLIRLMDRFGFRLLESWETTRLVGTMPDPGLDALFVRGTGVSPLSVDRDGPRSIREYARLSTELEERLCARLVALVPESTPVVIWGTGSLTLHLLTLDAFEKLDVVAFVDSNANYQGKTIGGKPVLAPSAMRDRSETIVVASHASEAEIVAAIRTKHGLTNPVAGLVSGNAFAV